MSHIFCLRILKSMQMQTAVRAQRKPKVVALLYAVVDQGPHSRLTR